MNDDITTNNSSDQPTQPAAPAVGPVIQPTDQPTAPVDSTQEPATSQPKPKKEGGVASFIVTLLVAVALVPIINLFFFQSYKVFGSSMYPTLHDGDRLIISKLAKTGAKITGKDYQPKRGDIVVFTSPREPGIQLIKRVIGLPGERVVVQNGKLTVYNSANPSGFNPDDADYGKDLPLSSGKNDVTVPTGSLFVSGDNRAGSNSLDSRNELGTVSEDLVIGKLELRLWPFDSAKFF